MTQADSGRDGRSTNRLLPCRSPAWRPFFLLIKQPSEIIFIWHPGASESTARDWANDITQLLSKDSNT